MEPTTRQARKKNATPNYLRELATNLKTLAKQLEVDAEKLPKAGLPVDGARMPEKAVQLLRQYRLNVAKSRVAAE